MIKCCTYMKCFTQVTILSQMLDPVDYSTALKAIQERQSYDAQDSLYKFIWDTTILEYIIYTHDKRLESEKKKLSITCCGISELNSSNPQEILRDASKQRQMQFFQAMVKRYF